MSGDQTRLRRDRLAALAAERGFLRVVDASLELGVSEVTVRSDLSALEAEGALSRVHGGALSRVIDPAVEPSFEQALSRDAATKRAIGIAAAGLVESGTSVILDVGTTSLAVAEALVAREELHDVVVITNGLSIALALERGMPRLSVIMTGGTLRPLQHSLVNPGATTLLETIHADIAFIGCNGVDVGSGVTNINLPEAEVKRRMVASSSRAIVLADASKLGHRHLGRIGGVADFALLVTAGIMPDSIIADLAHNGLPALVAE